MDKGEEAATRCGFVAIMGAPNAGKSTLVNALVGAKVSIVSDKVQTTRTLVRGIAMHGNAQIIFVDTPGIFAPSKRLERAMVAAAWAGGEEADIVMVMVDVSRKKPFDRETLNIFKRLKDIKNPALLVLNKIDQVKREVLLPLTQELNGLHDFARTFMISATKESGTKDILPWLAQHLPHGPFHYPPDDVSDMPMRLLAAEITREKLFHKMYREVPHALTVETESWENFENGDVRIEQVIFVEREGQRKIILGSGGEMIASIGEASRKELEHILECRVHLKLFVKVRGDWAEDPERYAPWGLDFQS